MLDFLDYPRQALWNFGRGVSDAVTGDPDANAGDMAPGIGGLGLALATAAAGGGIPLAVMLGSGLAGLGQGMLGREAMTPGQFLQKHFDVDPDSAEGTAGSFLLGAATDPLSFAIPGVPKGLGRFSRTANPELASLAERRLSSIDDATRGVDRLGANDALRNSARLDEFSKLGHPYYGAEIPEGLEADRLASSVDDFHKAAGEGAQRRWFGEAGPDVLAGNVPAGQDLASLSKVMAEMGLDPSRMNQVMESGGARDILDKVAANPPSLHFLKKGNYRGMDLPQIRGDWQLPIGDNRVPIDPSLLAEQLGRRPETMQSIMDASTSAAGALTSADAKQKRIQELMAQMMAQHEPIADATHAAMLANDPVAKAAHWADQIIASGGPVPYNPAWR